MKVSTINHVEVSSLCSNKCRYCPSSKVADHRKTGLMTMETFKKVLGWVDVLVEKGTQTEINLHGIGEPTLNPLLPEFIRLMRDHLPMKYGVHFNTNGNHMTDELAERLKVAGISSISITLHDLEVAANCVRILCNHRIESDVSIDSVLRPHDWAGQVDWLKANYTYPCPWTASGMVMVLWDGDVITCGIDAFATKRLGSVYGNIDAVDVVPFELCKKCHHTQGGVFSW